MLVSFRVLSACVVLSVISGIQLQAQKATCSFNTWFLNPNNPSNPAAFATGVNDNRTVVGAATYYFNKPNSSGFLHYFSGKITYWRPASAKYSGFGRRNNWGNTTGFYVDTLGIQHAVYLHGSTTTLIVHSKAAFHSTALIDINNLNTLLGEYQDANRNFHIFKRHSDGTFHAVPNFPGAKQTDAGGFNDNGVVVGNYILPSDASEFSHGFIYRNGSFATLDYRNKAGETFLVGISKQGVIAGNFWGNGFLYKNGTFKDIVRPNGQPVIVRGISANGIITGDGFDATCQ